MRMVDYLNTIFNTQQYKVYIKGKWRDPEKGVVTSLIL